MQVHHFPTGTTDGTCVVCARDTSTGFFLFDGTPELVGAALMLVGMPRALAEAKATSEPGDMRVLLCRSCAVMKGAHTST